MSEPILQETATSSEEGQATSPTLSRFPDKGGEVVRTARRSVLRTYTSGDIDDDKDEDQLRVKGNDATSHRTRSHERQHDKEIVEVLKQINLTLQLVAKRLDDTSIAGPASPPPTPSGSRSSSTTMRASSLESNTAEAHHQIVQVCRASMNIKYTLENREKYKY